MCAPTGTCRLAVGRSPVRPAARVHHAVADAGVPIAEVARRVGNSPEVIHRRYHGCIDGHEEFANAKILKALEEGGDAA